MPSLTNKVPCWTLVGLFLAFLDLWVAYVLLCVSACVFPPFKFLNFLGFFLPCPCSGLWGYQSTDFCWHRLLIDWPIETISFVLRSVITRFPFGVLFRHDRSTNSAEAEKICQCSSRTENKFEGKGIAHRRRKSVLSLRGRGARRKLNRDCSSLSSSLGKLGVYSTGNLDDHELGGGNSDAICGKESKFMVEEACWVKKWRNGEESSVEIHEKCRILERELAEEKIAHVAVCSELEKERAAAATAAEEAMGMILRLQEDKSTMELEARHYQRLIEEKFAYEEEEKGILQEILMKREKENLFLEKEIQCYKEMSSPVKEAQNNCFSEQKHNERETQSFTLCDESSCSDNENESPRNLPKYGKSSSSSSHCFQMKGADLCTRKGELKDAKKNMESVEIESTVHDIYVVGDKGVI